MKFPSGTLVMTPGVATLVDEGLDLFHYISRHLSGDWGDVCKQDWDENEFSLKNGYRLMSVYKTKHGKFYIITEHDRSATTALLPEEY